MTKPIPLPPGIRKECLNDISCCKRYGHLTVVYDPMKQSGATFDHEREQWSIFWPISEMEFIQRATLAVQITNLGEDVVTAH